MYYCVSKRKKILCVKKKQKNMYTTLQVCIYVMAACVIVSPKKTKKLLYIKKTNIYVYIIYIYIYYFASLYICHGCMCYCVSKKNKKNSDITR
jgi:hypothetical protein